MIHLSAARRFSALMLVPFKFAALLVIALNIPFFSAISFAQISPASINGIVLDSTQRALQNATVRLLDQAGRPKSETVTDRDGRFRFTAPRSEGEMIEASLAGFETAVVPVVAGSDMTIALTVATVRQQIVVSATRTEVSPDRIGTSVTVIGADEIRNRNVTSVGDLLQTAASAVVVKSGGYGSQTSLFVRGGESDYNKVLLDGIPLNEPGGFFDFSHLVPENLERIEVVRGPQSALFGTDAMSSVVQLFTAHGDGERRLPHFNVGAEGGKNNTWSAQSRISGGLERFDYAFDWARRSTDNQSANSFFRNTTASGDLGFQLSEKTQLRAILRGDLGRTGTPGQTAFQRPDRDSYLRRGDGLSGITLRNQSFSFLDQTFAYSFAETRYASRDLLADPDYVPRFGASAAPFAFSDFTYDQLNVFRRQHGSYQANFHAGDRLANTGSQIVTIAFDWDRENGQLGDRLFGEYTQAQRDNFGLTLQHQAIWRRVYLTNGVRVEDNGSFGTVLVPRSSIAFMVRQGSDSWGATKLKFNFGLGVKEPGFIESFSPFPSFLGNPNLAPERVRSFDFGVEQRFLGDRARVEINWFDNRFRDQIAFQTIAFNPFRGTYINLERAKAKGGEVLGEVAPFKHLRLQGSYSLLNSQITASATPSSPVFQAGRPLLRRPRHSGVLSLLWDWRQLNVTSTTVFIGTTVDSDFSALVPPLTSNPGYTKWDVSWSFRSNYRVTYFGVVENLLNRSYMEKLGYPALKLTFRAGLRLNF